MTVGLRDDVLEAARADLGSGPRPEFFESALGRQISDNDQRHLSWCGIWALAKLHQAGLGGKMLWRIGLGFVYRLPVTREPGLCDVGILQKVGGRTVWHHVLFVSRDEDGMATVIAGNTGPSPGKVGESAGRRVGDYTWYSIGPLESAAGSPPA